MRSALSIADYTKSFFTCHPRILAASLLVVCTTGLPCSLWSQSFQPCGGNICASTGAKVGIGTTSPLNLFQVHVGSDLNIGIRSYQNSAAIGAFNDAGNLAAPMNFDASKYSFTTGNVGIGTTNPTKLLSVNGVIQAKEVIVNTGWSDYVFEPGYRLSPLGEIAAYIKKNHHLPEIPSEAEVQQNGVDLGAMQAKLLAKIEELTLHMIQAEERNNRLEQKNRELQTRMARFEVRGVNGRNK